MTKDEQLKMLTIDIKTCKRCPLCYTRDKPAVSRGDPRSPLMVISDMPRETDDRSGEILTGRPGKKFDSLLDKAGLKPEQVYFTSIVKCWPGRQAHFPKDDSPAKCFSFLTRQLALVKPLIVVLVGPEALAWALLRGTGQNIQPFDRWVGPMFRRREIYDDLRFYVLPHPTTLTKVRNESVEEKCIKVLADAKEYIVAHQSGKMTPHIFAIDLKKEVVHSRKDQIEAFKWKPPELTPDPGPAKS